MKSRKFISSGLQLVLGVALGFLIHPLVLRPVGALSFLYGSAILVIYPAVSFIIAIIIFFLFKRKKVFVYSFVITCILFAIRIGLQFQSVVS